MRRVLGDVAARFRANIADNRAFLKKRHQVRPKISRLRGGRFLLLVIGAVILAGVVLDPPVGNFRRQWDEDLMFWAHRLTDIGKSTWILVPTGVAIIIGFALNWHNFGSRARLVLAKWMSVSAYIFLSVGVSGLIATILKRVIGRGRPLHYEEQGAYAFQPFSDASWASFPSGHSTTSGALFAAIAIFFPSLRIPALFLGICLGFTRILVGAHYPSDVIAGLAFGAWYAYFTALVFASYGLIFKFNENGWPVRREGFELVRLWRRRRRA